MYIIESSDAFVYHYKTSFTICLLFKTKLNTLIIVGSYSLSKVKFNDFNNNFLLQLAVISNVSLESSVHILKQIFMNLNTFIKNFLTLKVF